MSFWPPVSVDSTCWNQGQRSTANYVNQWIIDCNDNVDTKGTQCVQRFAWRMKLYSVKLLDLVPETKTKSDYFPGMGTKVFLWSIPDGTEELDQRYGELIQISQLNSFVLHRQKTTPIHVIYSGWRNDKDMRGVCPLAFMSHSCAFTQISTSWRKYTYEYTYKYTNTQIRNQTHGCTLNNKTRHWNIFLSRSCTLSRYFCSSSKRTKCACLIISWGIGVWFHRSVYLFNCWPFLCLETV